ncbi:MAG: hypothetical protein AAF587_07895 [Bacteroidota bacterium]
MNFNRMSSSALPQLSTTLTWLFMGLTVILFAIFPIGDRSLFQGTTSQLILDISLISGAVILSRQLIRGIFGHFWRYHTSIRPFTFILVQWSISLFTWAVMALPMAWSFFEWSYLVNPVESTFFQTDVALAFGMFAAWALIVFVLPFLRTPDLRKPIPAKVSVAQSL